MENRSVATLVIVTLVVVGAGYVVARSKQAPRGASAPDVAGPASTAPSAASNARGRDLLNGLKALLFADQDLKDELASMAQFDPRLKDILAMVDKGECADALRRSTPLWDASPSEEDSILLEAYVKSVCGDHAGAVEALQRSLAGVSGISHPTLQTWHQLRQLGVEPGPDKAREVLGLIVEIGFPEGTDVVAAYADGSSRFFSRQGGAVLGQEQRVEVQAAARRVISAAVPFAKSAPKEIVRGGVGLGVVRFTFLTPGGPLVSDAAADDLRSGKSELVPLFTPAAELMNLKIEGHQAPGR